LRTQFECRNLSQEPVKPRAYLLEEICSILENGALDLLE
jgi:hypothetical protein